MKHNLPKIYISNTLIDKTSEILASFAANGPSEGIVYWFGFENIDLNIVTTLIVPEADTDWGCVSTTAVANAQVLRHIVGTPLVLIGQAHSHPRHLVRHSDIDDMQTFGRFEGAISVVVPHFGKEGMIVSQCGVHRFMDGRYQLIKRKKVEDHFEVLPGDIDLRKR